MNILTQIQGLKKITIVTFLGFLSTFSTAEGESHSIQVTPFIYEVSHPNISQPSYLLGSLHIGVSISEYPSWVKRLHKNARADIYELDGSSPIGYQKLQQLYSNPESGLKSNQNTHSQETQDKLLELGVPQKFAPYFLIEKCGKSTYFLEYAYKRKWVSLDYELKQITKLNGKPIIELENLDIRKKASLFRKKKESSEDCNFQSFIDDTKYGKRMVDLYSQAYQMGDRNFRSGDEKHFENSSDRPDLAFRNNKWLDTLIPELNIGNTFTTVGVNHLFGTFGLLSLLETEGFKVKRLNEEP